MPLKLEQKIVGYKVITEAEPEAQPAQAKQPDVESMHEHVARPEMLFGSTYKIKTPQSEHALYVTVNDMILNMGTEHEERRPYEVFINSKNMDHFQWVVALTRVISAVFRKGGDVTFLVEELKGVFDPKGGYFKKGGVFMPSLVAEIGCAIELHLKFIGMIQDNDMDDAQQKFLQEKRKAFEAKQTTRQTSTGFPDNATLCGKCHTKALVVLDNCKTCLNCGDSKCG